MFFFDTWYNTSIDMYGELPNFKLEGSDSEIQAFPIIIESSPTGPKTAAVRLPTNDELLAYLQSQRSLYRDLGRGTGQSEDIPNPKADQKLFRAIRLDPNGAEFDDAEAARAIQLITRHRVTECERDGNGYVVTLSTPFGPVTHTVRIPYESEKAEYVRDFYKRKDMPHGMEERRFPPEVPVRLYDRVVLDISGYVDLGKTALTVPPHHKSSVVNALLSALSYLDPDLGPSPNS